MINSQIWLIIWGRLLSLVADITQLLVSVFEFFPAKHSAFCSPFFLDVQQVLHSVKKIGGRGDAPVSVMDKTDSIQIKFNGSNYSGWAFHLKHFMAGQGLMGSLDGTVTKDDKSVTTWDQNNSKVVMRILNSMDPSITNSLQSFSTASEMWSHLKVHLSTSE